MYTEKVYNFAAGPSKLPEEILKITQNELLNFNSTCMSVMELSHRSSTFKEIISTAEKNLEDLLCVPSNFKIIFLQGGGTGQFAAIPLNLCKNLGEEVDYIITGIWSQKAANEAEKYCKVNKIKSEDNFTSIPDYKSKLNSTAKYVYYCSNETVHGIEFQEEPEIGEKQILVSDMSSNFLTRPINFNKHGLIFAGAQKNAGIGGLTIVIVRKDLLEQANPLTPISLNYKIFAKDNSLYNTPPCFAIYISGLYFKWIKQKGGIKQMQTNSFIKSSSVYQVIDQSDGFYVSNVSKNCRSRVNIPFRIKNGDEGLEAKFLKQTLENKMLQLQGHRSVGGIRISLYNAISVEEAKYFVDFLLKFKKSN